jgi:uncharacterized protein YkwD
MAMLAGCSAGSDSGVVAALPPATAAAGEADPAAASARIVAATNTLREGQGLPALTRSPALDATAQAFAAYMANGGGYGHQADGRTAAERAKAAGYAPCLVGENIGFVERGSGLSTDGLAAFFADGWANSPVHRHNLLNRDASETGVGIARAAGAPKYFAVQLVGRPEQASQVFQIVNRTAAPVGIVIAAKRSLLQPGVVTTVTRCAPASLSIDGIGKVGGESGPPARARLELHATATGIELRTSAMQ